MRTLLVVLFFTTNCFAWASSWTPIGSPNANGNEILVDTASITDSALGRKAWVKYKCAKPQKVEAGIDKAAAGKAYSEMINLTRFDCDQRTMVLEHVIFRDGDGKSISDQDLPHHGLDVPPDTVLEEIYDFVCKWHAQ